MVNITPKEAQAALNDIQRFTDKTQSIIKLWFFYMIVWGLIWIVTFLATQLRPDLIGWIWWSMIGLGMIISALRGIRQSRQVRLVPGSQVALMSARLGIFYGLLYAFGCLWSFVLGLSSLQIGLLWITITMFGYIVAGVWLQLRLYIILGFAVTLMTISGYYLVPHYFWFWSAIFAGLPLVVVGVYWLRQR